ncbi:integrase core domain-containing protein [Streptomyces sp. 3N207]|uniref:integrase core domain-containing protein n=1 Tax=Streptomyces sp. 3N207 TaxID=3457417 RepID=UPI003FCF04CD
MISVREAESDDHGKRCLLPIRRLRAHRWQPHPAPEDQAVHPAHNGNAERHNRILAEELLYAHEFTNEDARATTIAVWNSHHNYHRPHGGAVSVADHLRQGSRKASPTSSPATGPAGLASVALHPWCPGRCAGALPTVGWRSPRVRSG